MLAFPRRPRPLDVLWVLATAAGLLMVASGVSLIYQMLWSLSQTGAEPTLAVTIVLAAVPLALGSAALRIAGRGRGSGAVSTGTRIAMAIGQHKAVAVMPVRVGRAVFKLFAPYDFGDVSHG